MKKTLITITCIAVLIFIITHPLSGLNSESIVRLKQAGVMIVASRFTLWPDRNGQPMIQPHLKQLRPFLGKGDFQSGAFCHQLIDALKPADLMVEKVAFSAFFQSRLEWVLQRAGIKNLIFAGIVTNGGVASTVRDAHVRDFHCVVLEDGCAAFSQQAHDSSIGSLSTIARIASCDEIMAELKG